MALNYYIGGGGIGYCGDYTYLTDEVAGRSMDLCFEIIPWQTIITEILTPIFDFFTGTQVPCDFENMLNRTGGNFGAEVVHAWSSGCPKGYGQSRVPGYCLPMYGCTDPLACNYNAKILPENSRSDLCIPNSCEYNDEYNMVDSDNIILDSFISGDYNAFSNYDYSSYYYA